MRRIYSHTRRSLLQKCARQYFYECYGGGYEPLAKASQLDLFAEKGLDHAIVATEVVNRIGRLKELCSGYQAAGLILHELIGQHWQHPEWSEEWFLRQAADRFDAWLSRSQNTSEPGPYLLEYFYQLADAEKTAAEARSRLLNALSNYLRNEEIRALVAEMQRGDEVLTEQPIGGLPKVRGFAIMGRIDVSSRSGLEVRIVDWKMGASVGDEDSLQLVLYGWWATERYGLPPECVMVQRVFLGDGVIEPELRLTGRLLDRGRARLNQDVERMEDLHEYGTKGYLEAFPVCEKEKVCHQCKFQGVCPAVVSATA